MTMQNVFDYVIEKIVRQGFKSVAHGQGRYRAHYGAKCAIGWLITDDEYHPDMEGKKVKTLLAAKEFRGKLETLRHAPDGCSLEKWHEFLADLQLAHDEAKAEKQYNDKLFLSNFMASIKQIAIKYEMRSTELEQKYGLK